MEKFLQKLFQAINESHEEAGKRLGFKDITWLEALPIIIVCVLIIISFIIVIANIHNQPAYLIR